MKAKKGSFNWSAFLVIAIVMAIFGMILTISAGIQQDITDDQNTGGPSCGTNSTGGDGEVIEWSACPSYVIGNESLNSQVKLARKQSTLVTAGVGIAILGLLIGAFAAYRQFSG